MLSSRLPSSSTVIKLSFMDLRGMLPACRSRGSRWLCEVRNDIQVSFLQKEDLIEAFGAYPLRLSFGKLQLRSPWTA
jgi:hypothetical protein